MKAKGILAVVTVVGLLYWGLFTVMENLSERDAWQDGFRLREHHCQFPQNCSGKKGQAVDIAKQFYFKKRPEAFMEGYNDTNCPQHEAERIANEQAYERKAEQLASQIID